MEIKGDEFIKTVQLRQEKDDIQKRLGEIEQLDNEPIPEESSPYEEQIIQTESELDDIMLQAPSETKKDNKKKYIVLALLLVVLFLISVLVIRFLTDSDNKEVSSTTSEQNTTSEIKTTDNDNIEQQYQKIINQKLNNIKEQKEQTELEEKSSQEALDIKAIEKEEQKLPEIKKDTKKEIAKKLKKDIFGLEDSKVEVKKTVKKAEPKKVAAKKVTKTTKLFENVKTKKTVTPVAKTSAKAKGYYIQIGSFTKTIDKKYIKNLNDKNIPYILHKAVVKGKDYTKVLVGPYTNRSEAKKDTSDVRKKLNISSSYILSL